MSNSHLIHGYHIEPEKEPKKLPLDSLDFVKSKKGYDWFHLCASSPKTRNFLEEKTDIEPIIIDALLDEETRPRALIKDNGALIILRAMNLQNKETPEDMISIRMWIDDHKIITTRKRDIKAINDIIGFIKDGNPPETTGDFLVTITDRLYERMEPYFVDMEDRISHSEELVATSLAEDVSQDIAIARKRAAIFARYVTPQKTVLSNLLNTNFKWLTEKHKEHLNESLEMVKRYIEELQELRDRSQFLNDELNNAHGRRLNNITYIFSVAATIFLPLGFITGLMGINVGGMPGVENAEAFWIFTGICMLIIVVQVLLFKKLKWF